MTTKAVVFSRIKAELDYVLPERAVWAYNERDVSFGHSVMVIKTETEVPEDSQEAIIESVKCVISPAYRLDIEFNICRPRPRS